MVQVSEKGKLHNVYLKGPKLVTAPFSNKRQVLSFGFLYILAQSSHGEVHEPNDSESESEVSDSSELSDTSQPGTQELRKCKKSGSKKNVTLTRRLITDMVGRNSGPPAVGQRARRTVRVPAHLRPSSLKA